MKKKDSGGKRSTGDTEALFAFISYISDNSFMIRIRDAGREDQKILETFLYHAIFVPEGQQRPKMSIIRNKDLYVYVEDFGTSSHDIGVIAEEDGKRIGAAWARMMRAYGYLDCDTPELAISILPGYRGIGVGTLLISSLLERLRKKKIKGVSLSVDKANIPAVRLYEKNGFLSIEEKEGTLLMYLAL